MKNPFEEHVAEINPKEKVWEEQLNSLSLVMDTMGQPVDPGIRETCVAFIVNGLPTTQSCEGHIDGGYPYPWVDIGPDYEDLGPELNEKRGRVNSMYKDALEKAEVATKKHFNTNEINYEDQEIALFLDTELENNLKPLYYQYEDELANDARVRTKVYIEKINSLMERYRPLDPKFSYRFEVSYSLTRVKIRPIHAERFQSASKSERSDILQKTRLEMSQITNLLRDNFFNS